MRTLLPTRPLKLRAMPLLLQATPLPLRVMHLLLLAKPLPQKALHLRKVLLLRRRLLSNID